MPFVCVEGHKEDGWSSMRLAAVPSIGGLLESLATFDAFNNIQQEPDVQIVSLNPDRALALVQSKSFLHAEVHVI